MLAWPQYNAPRMPTPVRSRDQSRARPRALGSPARIRSWSRARRNAALQIQRVRARIGGLCLRRRAAEQLELEPAGHGGRDLVLHREDVAQVAIEALRPHMRAVTGADESSRDAYPRPGTPHAAFEQMRDLELACDSVALAVRPLKENDEVRATTRSPATRDSRLSNSSDNPSAKYSLALSSLRLANGRTAIDRSSTCEFLRRHRRHGRVGGMRRERTGGRQPARCLGTADSAGSFRGDLVHPGQEHASGKPIRRSTKTSFRPQAGTSSMSSRSSATCRSAQDATA